MDRDREIKERLTKLPMEVWLKVELWFVYCGLKPATDVYVKETIYNSLNKTVRVADEDIERTIDFLLDMGLYYRVIDSYNSGEWEIKRNGKKEKVKVDVTLISKRLLVAKSSELVNQLYRAWISEEWDSEEVHLALGKLYGYPAGAVKEYARTMQTDKKGGFSPTIVSIREFRERFEDKYWYPYVTYLVRKGHEEEDCEVGIKWADWMREDWPELAEEFEKVARRMDV